MSSQGQKHTGLGDILDVIALKDVFILLRLRLRDGDTVKHWNVSHSLGPSKYMKQFARVWCTYLFTQEITDLNSIAIVLDDAVNREMGVYSTHFVLEALKKA